MSDSNSIESIFIAYTVLSGVSMLTNGIDIILYKSSFGKKQRNKSSSIEKMMFFLAIIEELIAVYWLINSILLVIKYEVKAMGFLCPGLGLFGLFVYNMEWVMVTAIIVQLRKIITNPVNGVLNADSHVKMYIVIDLIVACGSIILAASTQVGGISVSTITINNTHYIM